jgi:hypothetical protein
MPTGMARASATARVTFFHVCEFEVASMSFVALQEWWAALPHKTEWALVLVTVALVWVTWLLVKSARKSDRAQRETANHAADIARTARNTYVAQNLPRLTVSALELRKNQPMSVNFTLRNDGQTSAEIVRVVAHLFEWTEEERLPASPLYSGHEVQFDPSLLRPGESTYPIKVFNTATPGIYYTYKDFQFAWVNLYMSGFADYRDEIGNVHKIGFCRRYKDDEERFHSYDDPNYEYQR